MTDAGLLNGAVLFTREPVEAAIYYEWLIGLASGERPGEALASIGVFHVLAPTENDESAPGWMPVFSVESVEQAISRVSEMGVTVRANQIPDSRIAIVVNAAGIWTGLIESSDVEGKTHGTRDMNCDYCALDVGIATRTLTHLLDVDAFEILDDPYDMNILHSDRNITSGVLQMTGVEALSARPYWVTYFEVLDIGRSTVKAVESGSRVVIPPSKSPFNQYAVFRDPWGNIYGLSQLDSEPSEQEIIVREPSGALGTLASQVDIRS